jgi:hypothetical protein
LRRNLCCSNEKRSDQGEITSTRMVVLEKCDLETRCDLQKSGPTGGYLNLVHQISKAPHRTCFDIACSDGGLQWGDVNGTQKMSANHMPTWSNQVGNFRGIDQIFRIVLMLTNCRGLTCPGISLPGYFERVNPFVRWRIPGWSIYIGKIVLESANKSTAHIVRILKLENGWNLFWRYAISHFDSNLVLWHDRMFTQNSQGLPTSYQLDTASREELVISPCWSPVQDQESGHIKRWIT